MGNMKINLLFLISILLIPFNHVLQAQSVNIPKAALEGKSGSYDLQVKYKEFQAAKSGVRGLLFIPEFKKDRASSRPLVIFFHGNTKNRNYYKSSVKNMIDRAKRDGFSLLSLQNWWSFTGYTDSAEDSRKAANIISWELADAGAIQKDAVYLTGFSAGGLVALLTLHNSLEESGVMIRKKPVEYYPYAGVGSFKGNFYMGIGTFQINIMIDPDPAIFKKHYQKQYSDKTIYLTVGGKRDAKRVQKQAPEAYDFFHNYLGLNVVFKKFPKEPHNMPASNWKPFWKLVEDKLKQKSTQ